MAFYVWDTYIFWSVKRMLHNVVTLHLSCAMFWNQWRTSCCVEKMSHNYVIMFKISETSVTYYMKKSISMLWWHFVVFLALLTDRSFCLRIIRFSKILLSLLSNFHARFTFVYKKVGSVPYLEDISYLLVLRTVKLDWARQVNLLNSNTSELDWYYSTSTILEIFLTVQTGVWSFVFFSQTTIVDF